MSVKLIYERPEIHSPYSAVNRIEILLDDEATVDEMLLGYKEFLLAMGYPIKGEIEVVDYEN